MYNYRKFCSAPVVSESNKTSGNGGYGGLSRGRCKHVIEAYRTKFEMSPVAGARIQGRLGIDRCDGVLNPSARSKTSIPIASPSACSKSLHSKLLNDSKPQFRILSQSRAGQACSRLHGYSPGFL